MMIETGNTVVDGATGEKVVLLTSTFTSRPVIHVNVGGGSNVDPGDSELPSYNVYCYVTDLSFGSGAWSFKINAEPLDPSISLPQSEANKTAHGTYTSIPVSWRAIGSTRAT